LAREGLPNILIALGITIALAVVSFLDRSHGIWQILAAVAGLGTAFTLFFFRDPEREIKTNPRHILSPGDGTVLKVSQEEDDFVGPCHRITIFLSAFNVHINRTPIAGKVAFVTYRYGTFKAAFDPEASETNEQSTVGIENGSRRVKVAQVAGLVARRIINKLREGDVVEQGTRYGLIKFGSRMDVWIPRTCRVLVKPRQAVRGGLTVLAEWPGQGEQKLEGEKITDEET